MCSAFWCAWRVSYVVGCCNVVAILSMADMVCLDCMQKPCSAWVMLGLSHAVKFYCCCTYQIIVGRLLCVRLWSAWEKLSSLFIKCIWVGQVHVNSFVGVRGWQNGTRCRDGVRVLWCCSHLVWLIFEASISICACFHEGKLFVTCFCFFFFPFCIVI